MGSGNTKEETTLLLENNIEFVRVHSSIEHVDSYEIKHNGNVKICVKHGCSNVCYLLLPINPYYELILQRLSFQRSNQKFLFLFDSTSVGSVASSRIICDIQLTKEAIFDFALLQAYLKNCQEPVYINLEKKSQSNMSELFIENNCYDLGVYIVLDHNKRVTSVIGDNTDIDVFEMKPPTSLLQNNISQQKVTYNIFIKTKDKREQRLTCKTLKYLFVLGKRGILFDKGNDNDATLFDNAFGIDKEKEESKERDDTIIKEIRKLGDEISMLRREMIISQNQTSNSFSNAKLNYSGGGSSSKNTGFASAFNNSYRNI